MLYYVTHLANLACIYVVLSISLDLLVGYTGLFSVTTGGLFGVGAYVAALAALHLGLPLPAVLAMALLASACAGAIVAVPSIRVSGDYLVVATIGMQVLLTSLFTNADKLTGGSQGLLNIPAPALFSWRASDPGSYLPLNLTVTLLVVLVAWLLAVAPFGRSLKAIREDEIAATALGKHIVAYKIVVFVVSSAMAGAAGALYAYYVSFIYPPDFSMEVSILIFSMMIIGGAGTLRGAIIGPLLLMALGEGLRFANLPNAVVGELREALYGLGVVLCMFLRPQGIAGESGFGSRQATRSLQESDGTGVEVGTIPADANAHPGEAPFALVCDGIVAGYHGRPVLHGVSLHARKAEIVVVMGHNGAGKSTVLSAIVGLVRVDRGRVLLNGKDITHRQDRMLTDHGIGLVPQTGGVFAHMTVRENLLTAGYLRRRDSARLNRRIDDVLALFPALRASTLRRAGELSGGQQRILALAMVLVPEHRVLLLDEPSIGLSPLLVEEILHTVRQINRSLGVTILLSEQNIRPALQIADRAYVLKTGRVRLQDSAEGLLRRADLWRLF